MNSIKVTTSAGDYQHGEEGITVETNGLQGGDSGHGGFMDVIAKFSPGMDLLASDTESDITKTIRIIAKGDWEQLTVYKMALAIVEAYERGIELNKPTKWANKFKMKHLYMTDEEYKDWLEK